MVDPRGRVCLDAEEHVGEVGDGVDAVCLAGGDERVEPGQVLAGAKLRALPKMPEPR